MIRSSWRRASISALILFAWSVSASAAIELVTAENQPPDYPTVKALEHMAKLIGERTHGDIHMTVVPSAKLGSEKETVELTMQGKIALNRVNLAVLTSSVPEAAVLTMPFIFRNVYHMRKVADRDVGQEILKAFEKQNLVG